jgi:TolB protein
MIKKILTISVLIFYSLNAKAELSKIEIDKLYGARFKVSASSIGQSDYHSKESDAVLDKIFEIIKNDLSITPDIDFYGIVNHQTEENIIDVKRYDFFGINFNININIAPKDIKTGDYFIEIKVYNVKNGDVLAEKRYQFNIKNLRKTSHIASDISYFAITGKSGYFQSKLLFTSNDQVKNIKSTTSIYMIDLDGFGEKIILQGGLLNNPSLDVENKAIIYNDLTTGVSKLKAANILTKEKMNLDSLYKITQEGEDSILNSASLCNTKKCILYSEEFGNKGYIKLASPQFNRTLVSSDISASVNVSPDDSEIVYEARRNGRRNLYKMNIETPFGTEEMLTGFDGIYAEPKYSPDGGWIVFNKLRNKIFHIGIIRPDKTEEQIIYSEYLISNPTFMPNSDAIIFSEKTSPTAKPRLKIIDLDGRVIKTIDTSIGATNPHLWTIR